MNKNKNNVNKKLVTALMAYKGLNGKTLGDLCDPPVCKVTIHFLLNYGIGSNRLMSRVVEILAPCISDLKRDLDSISSLGLFDALFPPAPCINNKSVGREIIEEGSDNLPERKEKYSDDQRSDG